MINLTLTRRHLWIPGGVLVALFLVWSALRPPLALTDLFEEQAYAECPSCFVIYTHITPPAINPHGGPSGASKVEEQCFNAYLINATNVRRASGVFSQTYGATSLRNVEFDDRAYPCDGPAPFFFHQQP